MAGPDRAALINFLKTNDTLEAALITSRKSSSCQRRIMAWRNLSLAATATAVLGFASLANAAIVMNGNFEIEGTGPTDALAWTGENGTTILRTATGGVSGSAGGLISNSTPVSAAGPLTENTGFAGGDPAVGGLLYTFRFDSQRTFANGGVFQAQLVARDDANTPLGFPINVTLNTGSAGFETFSQDFTAPAGTTRFEINFFAITGADAGSSSSVVVDNVQIFQIVPEPTAWALLLGGMGLLARRRARPALRL
jgi:hypothetical protein